MDSKASAKSKRAHSLRAKRASHNQNPKVLRPSNASGGADSKKPQNRDRNHTYSSALPTNWDRYDEEVGSDLDEPSTNFGDHVAPPKSKGADFAYLVSQAHSNPVADTFPSVEDFLPDFHQGISSMLSVRGKSILSWIGDDNFIVDDDATPSYDSSYLSMDLHALEAQLAKVDISQRLFIEADLLPDELQSAGGSNESSNQASKHVGTSHASETDHRDESPLVFHGFVDANNSTDNNKVLPSATSKDSSPVIEEHGRVKRTSKNSSPWTHISQGVEVDLAKDTEQQETRDSKAHIHINSIADSKDKKAALKFEAAEAEAELDRLLDSFGEVKLVDSFGSNELPGCNAPFFKKPASNYMIAKHTELSDHSKHGQITATNTLDNAIDLLLGDPSYAENQKNTGHPQKVRAVPADLPYSSTVSGSKALDDFDSWLDTI